ncbi:MAG: RagB/SusD family nutrient uptake outer membrane protein [Gemmatimonadales bacterium]|nr:MAG: RagB/SusD family nutrient uptake outer membrane protein [Gemmatimonadales bacterium]
MRHIQDSLARGLRLAVVALLIGAAAACDFDIEDPTAITAGDLESDQAMSGLMVGAVRSYDESYNRMVMFTALVADEQIASGSWPTWHDVSKRGVIDQYAGELDHSNIAWRQWREQQRARGDAEEAIGWMEEILESPGTDARNAVVHLYAGMLYADFGEVFCEVAFDGGPRQTVAESFATARERLQRAISIVQNTSQSSVSGSPNTASVDNIAHMAHLLLARIAMEEGDYGTAISHAQQVPRGMKWVGHYPPGQGNAAWTHWMSRGESTVQAPFRNTGDLRVPVEESTILGPDTETILWFQRKYQQNDFWPVGKWQEARLIEAEARLASEGEVGAAVALMNEGRAEWNLDPISSDISEAEAWEHLRTETMYELFLEGRRMILMRRWNEFPSGWQTCLPISGEEERTNPNL